MEALVVWCLGGLAVGLIAAGKRRSPLGWFAYGFLIWPVALVHVLFVSRNE